MSPHAARLARPRPFWSGHALTEGQAVAGFHRDRDRRRLKAMARGLLGTGLLVVLALGVVGLRVQQVRLSYQLDDLRARKAGLEEAQRRLRIEADSLKSLARIEGKARAELGMRPPSRNQVQVAREFVPSGGGTSTATASRTASVEEAARTQVGAR
ncbi:MAG: cell division protein FtsL [Candidatus Rokuibacteriota bacterium]|nr:MAG: cell division protein FtsL [Candidatus Rokubacteria bacterium]